MVKKALINTILFLILLLLSACKSKNFRTQSVPPDLEQNIIWAIEPSFDSAKPFSCGLAVVQNDNKYYFIEKSGQPAWDTVYEEILIRYPEFPGFRYGVAIVKDKSSDEYRYLFRNGCFFKDLYTDAHWPIVSTEQLSLCSDSGKYGYINLQDLWYIGPEYLGGKNFVDGISVVYNENDRIQYIVTNTGKFVETNEDYYLSEFGEGLLVADNHSYVSAEDGKIEIQGPFERCKAFSENMAAVMIDGKYGYINRFGEIVIEPIYKDAQKFSCGIAKVTTFENDDMFINAQGDVIFHVDSETDNIFQCNCLPRKLHNHWGIIDTRGNWILNAAYTDIRWSRHGFFRVFSYASEGLFNPITGAFIKPEFDSIYPISNQVVLLEKDGQLGLADYYTGEIIVQPCFQGTLNFGEGLISVKSSDNQKYGFIDYRGQWIIPPIFDYAYRFSEGLSAVKMNGKMGYIANPLLYSTWSPTSWDRVGKKEPCIFTTEPDKLITVAEFCDIIEKISRSYGIVTDKFRPDCDDNQMLTRSCAAKLLSQFAKAAGDNTGFFRMTFLDVELKIDLNASEIAYATAVGIFDFDSTNHFFPNKNVKYTDAVDSVVKLCEYLLDIDYRTHPERTDSVVSKAW